MTCTVDDPRVVELLASTPVYETSLPLPGRRQGKVRDIYTVPPRNSSDSSSGDESNSGGASGGGVLIVASDRISAFDVVMPTPVPGKGKLLAEIATNWFDLFRETDLLADFGLTDHLISTTPEDVPGLPTDTHDHIRGRMMYCRAARTIPVEFVVRGYITGSGWVDYQNSGGICGIPLPAGLKQCDRLPQPIFTPATKADEGHDANIDFEAACAVAGRATMERLREASFALYNAAAKHAEQRGIIIADTKFEFGHALAPGSDANGAPTEEIMLIDEILTPDSSRFWPAEDYAPGRDQNSFDKQYVRNYLLTLVADNAWDKTPPGPELPDEIVGNTLARYIDARERLFGG